MAAILEHLFAGGLLGTGQYGAEHHAVGPGGQGLGYVAGVFDAAVGNHRHIQALEARHCLHNRGNLRHPHPGHHPGGADGARPNPHLNRVGPGLGQGACAFGGGNVTGDNLHRLAKGLFELPEGLQNTPAVAVGAVQHQHIHAGFHQGSSPGFQILRDPHRRPHQQTALGILGREGELLAFGQVFEGQEAPEPPLVFYQGQFFNFVLAQ